MPIHLVKFTIYSMINGGCCLHLASFPTVVSRVTYPKFLGLPSPSGRPNPSAALTVPKVVSRLERSSAVIAGVRPEIMRRLLIGSSMVVVS